MRWFSRLADLLVRMFDATHGVSLPESIDPRRWAMIIGCTTLGTLAVYGLYVACFR